MIDQHDMQSIWQNQPAVTATKLTREQLHAKSHALKTTVQKRNAFEQIVIVLCVIVFAYYAWKFQGLLIELGCLLSIAAAVFVSFQLRKRGSAQAAPDDAGLQSCIAFHRKELEHQRDLLGSVLALYLLPFVPGLSFFLVGLAAQQPARHRIYFILVGVVYAAGFFWIMKLNSATRDRIQHEVDELKALEAESK